MWIEGNPDTRMVFYDNFEPLNALGSKATLYKVGAVYTKLMCLPPHMQPIDRKWFKDDVIFTPLIEEYNYFQNTGIDCAFLNFTKVKVIPVLLCGDNLGLNGLLGFTECFRAIFFCRFCKWNWLMQKHDTTIKANLSLWRSLANYAIDVALKNISVTGIFEDSDWNNLINFHVTFNISIDIMHDLLEGICHYDICNILLANRSGLR